MSTKMVHATESPRRLRSRSLQKLTPLVMGGAGFSYQLHPTPQQLPVRQTILRAFELGVRALDTSPYYEPSEQLMGAALAHADITSKYSRDTYTLMTKVGRIAEERFDYSPDWIRQSVARSLQRFQTPYLDVVFCHDVEFVGVEEAVTAVGVLFELVEAGQIKHAGISGYDIDVLVAVAKRVQARYSRPVDVVQTWAQLTLQNTQLEARGLRALQDAGVTAICSASPLAVGLLRDGGIPVGSTGDWHPAPQGLRESAQRAATWTASQGDALSSVGLRYSISSALRNTTPDMLVTTITGVSTIKELEENVQTAKHVLQRSLRDVDQDGQIGSLAEYDTLDPENDRRDQALYAGVRTMLEPWLDYDFSRKTKRQPPSLALKQDVASKRIVPTVAEVEVVAVKSG